MNTKSDDNYESNFKYESRYRRRIFSVYRWRNPPVKSFLKNLYYYNWVGDEKKGYRNFFNHEQNHMTVGQAKDYLNWNFFDNAHFTAFRIYTDWTIKRLSGSSREEKEICFRDLIRDAVPKLLDKIGIDLNWIGAVNAKSTDMVAMIVFSNVVLSEKIKADLFKEAKPREATFDDCQKFLEKRSAKRDFFEYKDEIENFTILKKCIPHDLTVQWEAHKDNMSIIGNILANSFYLNMLESDDRSEYDIDELIKLARDTKFELPIEFYAHRYLDAEGNLMTKDEKDMLDHRRKMDKWKAEHKQQMLS